MMTDESTQITSFPPSCVGVPRRPVAVVRPCRRRFAHALDSGHVTADSVAADSMADTISQSSVTTERHQVPADSEQEPQTDDWTDVMVNARRTALVRPSTLHEGHQLTMCPYYHGALTAGDAKRLLRDKPAGTYLLRDSQAGGEFSYCLTLRTGERSHSVTSVRIARVHDSRYRLDCDVSQTSTMPTFSCVPSLVKYFVTEGRCVLVGPSSTSEQPLTLKYPLNKAERTLSGPYNSLDSSVQTRVLVESS